MSQGRAARERKPRPQAPLPKPVHPTTREPATVDPARLPLLAHPQLTLAQRQALAAQICIRSILGVKTLDQLMAAMEDEEERMFFHGGFGDNPAAATHCERP